jgi:hypothetical protein
MDLAESQSNEYAGRVELPGTLKGRVSDQFHPAKASVKPEAAVIEGLQGIQASALAEIRVQSVQGFTHQAAAHPLSNPALAGLVGGITVWQLVPGRGGYHFPEDALQDRTRVGCGATRRASRRRRGEERLKDPPLFVGEVKRCGVGVHGILGF